MRQSASPALHKVQCPRPSAHYEQTECGDSVEPERNVVVIMSRCSVSLSLHCTKFQEETSPVFLVTLNPRERVEHCSHFPAFRGPERCLSSPDTDFHTLLPNRDKQKEILDGSWGKSIC